MSLLKYLEEYYQEHLEGKEYIIELETQVSFFYSFEIQPLAYQDLNSKNVICSSLSRRPWSNSLQMKMKYIIVLVSVPIYTRLEYGKIKILSFQFYSIIQIEVGVIKEGFTNNCSDITQHYVLIFNLFSISKGQFHSGSVIDVYGLVTAVHDLVTTVFNLVIAGLIFSVSCLQFSNLCFKFYI
ncbi:Hypothetical_protein [Hexamita inflata]|uniref:Hypothetical_protein n=1 Tax=Hexamita inflata TaxID=28002 RepID=A0AA86NN29_9EUKA|nr:Hypothetical protein HINF_LOCUS10042 [Hexamita inflata]